MFIFHVSSKCNITVDDFTYDDCVSHLRGCFGDRFVNRLLKNDDVDVYEDFGDRFVNRLLKNDDVDVYEDFVDYSQI